ncbi:hypothetical protein MYAM1_000165 [Malassezia yamatoensis]|uniref:Uncharacterized protein n=1 Tax=Malassezia yamatoensis TaxID=253288 RepID=A0AAJ6CH50_9BASI|nr:hypothetical protein MYAM1_000165 [Malassezia yamatoensis]
MQIRSCASLSSTDATLASQKRSGHLAELYSALRRADPFSVFDTFLHITKGGEPLAAAEYRHIVQVMLQARPQTRQTTDQILVLIEHVKRTQRMYSKATSPSDRLIARDLSLLLQDAYLWNALLSSARGRQKHLPLQALAEVLDLFVAAEHATNDLDLSVQNILSNGTGSRPKFPDTISYNILLHSIARSVPKEVGRQRTLPSSLSGIRREIQLARYTRKDAQALFFQIWQTLQHEGKPTPISWAIRVFFLVKTGQITSAQEALRESIRENNCSATAITTLLDAYAQNHRADPKMPEQLASIYTLLRSNTTLDEHPRPGHSEEDNSALRLILGLEQIPANIVPERGTYAVLIRCFTQADDLNRALQVLHDMVMAPNPASVRGQEIERDSDQNQQYVNAQGSGMAPSADIYHSFFLAFARRGTPASVKTRGDSALAWEWSIKTNNSWNVTALAQLFEGYLRVHPKDTPPFRSKPRQSNGFRAPAPNVKQLNTVLLALCKVGQDHAAWVEMQWARLAEKFGDEAYWYSFHTNQQINRVLEELRNGTDPQAINIDLR